MPAERTTAYAILVAMPLFFVSNLVIGRAVVGTVAPWTLAFLRWGLASLLLLPFAAAGVRRYASSLLAAWRQIALLGFLGMWVCGGVVYVSLAATTATHATLIYTTSPVFVVVLAALLARRALPLWQLLGTLFGAAGVTVIVLEGDPRTLIDLDFNVGDIGILICAVAWAVYTLVLRSEALRTLPTLTLFLAIMIAGTLCLTPFMFYEVASGTGWPTGGKAWASIVALAIVPSLLSFSSYQYSIKTVGAPLTSVFMYLFPPYGVALSVVFLGERLALYHAVGFALIVAGIALAGRVAPDTRPAGRR